VAGAAQSRGVPFVAIDLWQHRGLMAGEDGRPRWIEATAPSLGAGPVFSAIGGACHHTLGLLVHPRPFDFVLPSAPDLPLEDVGIVPFDGVRAALAGLMEPYLKMMEQLVRAAPCRVFHLEPPPVYGDERRMAPDLPALPIYKEYPSAHRDRVRVSPRHLRYKLWRLHSEVLAEFCRVHGIEFVPHPPMAADVHGFLDEPYYLDPMHANHAYGDLVLRQMEERVAVAANCGHA
jgi:hypothetical protein